MILNNAELRKNIWLDFSSHRMILTPIIIGLIIYLFYLATTLSFAATISYYLACFFIFLWGTKNASEAVIEEANQNTWDFQRQSAMTPFEMSLGKLLGSTLFAWYGALICLTIYVGLSAQISNANTSFLGTNIKFLERTGVPLNLFILICGGLFTQTIALLLSLQIMPSSRYNKNIKSFRYFLIALIIGSQFTSNSLVFSKFGNNLVNWHNIDINQLNFVLSSLVIFLAWGLIGLYRSFAKELQYPNVPWAWLLFNVFCLIYFSGLATFKQFDATHFEKLESLKAIYTSVPTYFAFIVALILMYTAIIIDNLSILQYKKLLIGFKQGRLIEALGHLPKWVVSFALVLVTGFICLTRPLPTSDLIPNFSSTALIITTSLFAIRDICLLHYFNFKQPNRILSTFVLYLFMLYIIIPGVLSLIQLSSALPAFIPSYGQNTVLALGSTGAQIITLIAWIKHKTRDA